MQSKNTKITCHKAAVLADIHSNYHAFQACFEDAIALGADCFLFLGDYISDLAEPRRTLDLVYAIQAQYPTFCLRGNRERYMLDCEAGTAAFTRGSKTGSLLFTYQQLRRRDLNFIRSLPLYGTIEINGIPFELAHAIRNDDRYYFEPGDEKTEGIFSQMQYSHFLTGHSHRQYIQRSQGKLILNPGSVGVPQCGNSLAQYALLDMEDGVVHCLLRQVEYDLDSTIHAQFESGLADMAPHWAISVLYDIITGQEYTMQLLEQVQQLAAGNETGIYNEEFWHRAAQKMGMKFTEAEILTFRMEHRKRGIL